MKLEHGTAAREPRTSLDGEVRFSTEWSEGRAWWLNISRTGGSLQLRRYLRPGRELRLEVPAPGADGYNVAVEARVAWCRPAGADAFVAGVQFRRNDPFAALAVTELRVNAERAVNSSGMAVVTLPVWRTLRLAAKAV